MHNIAPSGAPCVLGVLHARGAQDTHTQCACTPTPLHCPLAPLAVLCFFVSSSSDLPDRLVGLISQSFACRGLTGRVTIAFVTRHNRWYKTGVLTVTCETAVQIGGSILSQHAAEVDFGAKCWCPRRDTELSSLHSSCAVTSGRPKVAVHLQVVDAPVVTKRHAPQFRGFRKTGVFPKLQYIANVVDVPVALRRPVSPAHSSDTCCKHVPQILSPRGRCTCLYSISPVS